MLIHSYCKDRLGFLVVPNQNNEWEHNIKEVKQSLRSLFPYITNDPSLIQIWIEYESGDIKLLQDDDIIETAKHLDFTITP